jgi:glucuronosyltransferase
MQGHSLATIIAALLLAITFIESKNVILLTVYATSHIRLYAHVANELSKLNHSVWIMFPSDDSKRVELLPAVKTIWVDDHFDILSKYLCNDVETTVINAIETGNEPDWGWLDRLEDSVAEEYLRGLKDGKFIEFIRGLKPDFIIIDWFPSVNDHVAIPYKLKLPFAVLSALQFPISAQMTYSPVLEAFNSPYILNKATLFEQMKEVIHYMYPVFNQMFNDRGHMQQIFPNDPNVPTTTKLMSQAEIYIIETDPIFDYPRPALPNMKFVGGLSAGPAKDVPEPFKSFVDRSQKAGVGVAVMSFGTLLLNLPKKLELKLVAVLKRIKLNTIWRANITSPDPDKILTSTWIPQNDLLGNKHVKVYITHSGTHSIYEGIYHGKPTVCLPVFYDQFHNANRAVERDYCIMLDLLKASEDEIVNAIEEVASSQKIKSAIGKASEIYRELYKNPKKEAAFWIDHVMRYGGSYMRSSAQKIPMYLFVLDYVVAFLSGVMVAVGSVIFYFVLRRILSFFIAPERHYKKD